MALGAEAPQRTPDPDGQPVGEGQQAVRLDRERIGRRLDVEPAADARDLGGERGAALARHVLDHAGRVDEVERSVLVRQPRGDVGLQERAGVGRPRGEVDAGDLQLGLQRPQADGAAADIEDLHARRQTGEAEELGVAARAGACGKGGRDARPGAAPRGPVDVGGGHGRGG
jgi:hypothetical protein